MNGAYKYKIMKSFVVTKNSKPLNDFHWKCQHTWKTSAKNTVWCLLGCSIGDFGTILFFQLYQIPWSTLSIMILAIVNGILTSFVLETIILLRQMKIHLAFKTAINMSLISMISMELSMNTLDWAILGEAKLVWWIIPIMLIVGFLTPWPYNYYRLKKFQISCH